MGKWSTFARMMDLEGAWKTTMHTWKKGGMPSAFGAYFSGAHMPTFMKDVGAGLSPNVARGLGARNLGRGALRAGVFGGTAAGGAYMLGRSETGKKIGRTAAPLAAGYGMYRGMKYGLGKWQQMGLRGSQWLGGGQRARGLATLAGLGTWAGLRG